MFNQYTLKFQKPELQSQYIRHRNTTIKKDFLVFTILAQISLLLSAIHSILLFDIISLSVTIAVSVIQALCFFQIRRKTKYIDGILLWMQIIFTLQLGIKKFINPDFIEEDYYILGMTSIFYQFVIYMQGCDFLKTTILLAIVMIPQFVFKTGYLFMDFFVIEIYCAMIAVKYSWEVTQKKNFLVESQNLKWNQVLEDVLPTWAVTICFDKVSTLFKVIKINNCFKKEFDIKDDFSFRSFIRKLHVYPILASHKDEAPAETLQLNFEQHLILILEENYDNNINQQFISYLKHGQGTREFKISLAFFQSVKPQVLLVFEEIIGNKYELLEQTILWRDKLIFYITSKNMAYLGRLLTFLKVIKKMRVDTMSKFPLFFDELEVHLSNFLYEGYKTFNDNLNTHTLFQINYSKLKYKIDSINTESLFNQLSQDLGVEIEMPRESHKQILNSRKNSNQLNSKSPFNFINDKQKLMQTLITVIEFIEFLLSTTRGDDDTKQKIQLSLRAVKQKPAYYAVRLSHPSLAIPLSLEYQLNGNWPGSLLNKQRFGIQDHISQIQQLQECFSDQQNISDTDEIPGNTSEQNLDKFITSGLPVVQYLISQLGPFNKFFLKNKIQDGPLGRKNVLCLSNQIKLYVYKNLYEVIDEINSNDFSDLDTTKLIKRKQY